MKDLKKISTRQLVIFYCLFSFSIKFLSLPSLLAEFSGRDAWLAALLGTVLELLMLFVVLNVLKRGAGSDIYSDVRRRVTGVGAKIFVLMMLFIFLVQIFLIADQIFRLLDQHLFDSLNVHKFLVPLMLMGVMFCFMPARAIFRSGEVFWLFILVALVLAVFPALRNVRVSELSPLTGGGVLNAVFRNLIFFETAAFLLVFSGDIKIEKKFTRKFMLWAGGAGLSFVFFVAVCTMLFGSLAPIKTTAIAELTTYSSFLTQGGRLDWLLVCTWVLLLLLRFGVTFYCAFASIRYILNIKHRAGFIGFGIVAVVYPIFVLFDNWTTRTPVAITIAVLFLAVPLVAFLCSLVPTNHERQAIPRKNNQAQGKA